MTTDSLRRVARFTAVAIAIGALAVAATRATASAVGPPTRVIVGFREARADREIAAIATRHGMVVEAVYFWTAGMSGTHRSYAPLSTETLLGKARDEARQSFENGVSANLIRLSAFASRHTDSEVAMDAALASQARSLLNIRAQLAAAAAAARSGAPLVYAVEMRNASPSQLAALRGDGMVRGVAERGSPGFEQVKPDAYQREWLDGSVAALSASELVSRMHEILRAAGKE